MKIDTTVKDLRPLILVATFRDKKKDYHVGLTKSAGLIKKLVNKSLYPFLNYKSVAKMLTFLDSIFHHILPMSITRIFSKACNIKLSDCKDIIDYTGCY